MTKTNGASSEHSATIAEYESDQVKRANSTGRQPVVFVHGLWLLPSSWDRWVALYEGSGYTALTPGWPDDPETVEQAKEHPEVFAGKTIGEIADHYDGIIRGLDKSPAIIGHSFGGLLAQILAGRGLARATVAIDPAPFRGVLPLPISALKSARPVLGNPANRNRAVPLTYEQFRFGFANAVGEDEAKDLYESFAVPASGVPRDSQPRARARHRQWLARGRGHGAHLRPALRQVALVPKAPLSTDLPGGLPQESHPAGHLACGFDDALRLGVVAGGNPEPPHRVGGQVPAGRGPR
jgi:pimeloyl-ACP methyl ester carboxylesterase